MYHKVSQICQVSERETVLDIVHKMPTLDTNTLQVFQAVG